MQHKKRKTSEFIEQAKQITALDDTQTPHIISASTLLQQLNPFYFCVLHELTQHNNSQARDIVIEALQSYKHTNNLFRNLPTEILDQILSCLSNEDRKSARVVSSQFRQLIDSAKNSMWYLSDTITIQGSESKEGSESCQPDTLEVGSGFWQHSTLPFFVTKVTLDATSKHQAKQMHKVVALLPPAVKHLQLFVRSGRNLPCLFGALPRTLQAFTFYADEYKDSSGLPALCLLPPTLEFLKLSMCITEADMSSFQLPLSVTTLELQSLSGNNATWLPTKLRHLTINDGEKLLLSADDKLPDTLQKLAIMYTGVQLIGQNFAFLPHSPSCKTSLTFFGSSGLNEALMVLPPIHNIKISMMDTWDWLSAVTVEKVTVLGAGRHGQLPQLWNNFPPSAKSLLLQSVTSTNQLSQPKCHSQVTHLSVSGCTLGNCWDQVWVCLPNLTHLTVSNTDIQWTDHLIASLPPQLMKLKFVHDHLPGEFLQAMATHRPHVSLVS